MAKENTKPKFKKGEIVEATFHTGITTINQVTAKCIIEDVEHHPAGYSASLRTKKNGFGIVKNTPVPAQTSYTLIKLNGDGSVPKRLLKFDGKNRNYIWPGLIIKMQKIK